MLRAVATRLESTVRSSTTASGSLTAEILAAGSEETVGRRSSVLVWFTMVNDIDAILLIASLDSNSNSTSVWGGWRRVGVRWSVYAGWGLGVGGLEL